ncbi:MAG: AAA family ATPase [Selenomonadaceae bacterium]|nr:AAA family ATPase [Selenomonadaceae bacterium]
MARTVAVGVQNFESYIERNCFYVDKTKFIKQWWNSNDDTTVIMRPRRFGKTLTMDMVKTFFSVEYKEKGEALFGNLEIWQDEEMRNLQGTYPVIFLTFADIKTNNYEKLIRDFRAKFAELFRRYDYLLKSDKVSETQKKEFIVVENESATVNLKAVVKLLSEMLYIHHGKKPIIILDEYDTPMQEAYISGYWSEAVEFLRNFFNSTFKTNPYLNRSLMTGITRISKESIFSDFNHVQMVTMQSSKYADCFGFTEEEVFAAMDECGLMEKDIVKKWYNGFQIGNKTDIYNPWSIINYLSNEGRLAPYWANSSSNGLINKMIREGNADVKLKLDKLLRDEPIEEYLNDEIIFNNLDDDETAMWSLFYASGYVTGDCISGIENDQLMPLYKLHITNLETKNMFRNMVIGWFAKVKSTYNDFIKAMLLDDVDYMEEFINKIALATFSSFDAGKRPSESTEPEKFYHGFVLGMMVDLRNRFIITSNRESGFGRYDIMLEPKNDEDNAIIIEFKVFKPKKDGTLENTVRNALKQIDDMKYETIFLEKGIPAERIRKYGFAFEGKKVLIGSE